MRRVELSSAPQTTDPLFFPGCFKCEKDMRPVFEPKGRTKQLFLDPVTGQFVTRVVEKSESDMESGPDDGLSFYSPGNYGSTAWDPMDGRQTLEIHICDECIKEHSNRVAKVEVTKIRNKRSYNPWIP